MPTYKTDKMKPGDVFTFSEGGEISGLVIFVDELYVYCLLFAGFHRIPVSGVYPGLHCFSIHSTLAGYSTIIASLDCP